jgi:hypothetical protein
MKANFSIAYIISAYKNPDQLIRIVHRLADDRDIFLIHVDKKTSRDQFMAMTSGLKALSNVHFLDRHVCSWGDFGHVKATLKGLDYLADNAVNHDTVVLLTGQDYPLRLTPEIRDFLNKNRDKSFMEYTPLGDQGWSDTMHRVDNIHLWLNGRIVSIPRRPRPFPPRVQDIWQGLSQFVFTTSARPALDLYSGSSYWVLNRASADYITSFVKQNKSYSRYFKRAHISDELYFQTILLNSSHRSTIVNDNHRYIDWSRPDESPAVMRLDDLDRMLKSNKLFARKFDETIESEILDTIDKVITSRAQD